MSTHRRAFSALIVATCLTAPATAQAAINQIPASGRPDLVLDNTSTHGRLVVFLPGTDAPNTPTTPSDYSVVTRAAADSGFDAIALDYDNDQTLASLCGSGPTGDDCLTQSRGEIAFGDRSGYDNTATNAQHQQDLVVSSENSIVGRLVERVIALGWAGDYLVPDRGGLYHDYLPNWSRIVISGHSQGGGAATFIGSLRPAMRVVAFSGPDDTVGLLNPTPSWITRRPAVGGTPVRQVWGLRNTNEGVYGSGTDRNWLAYGFLGTTTSVDAAQPPYGGSHRLTTNLKPSNCLLGLCGSVDRHGSTAYNGRIAYLGATPALLPAWQFMFRGGL